MNDDGLGSADPKPDQLSQLPPESAAEPIRQADTASDIPTTPVTPAATDTVPATAASTPARSSPSGEERDTDSDGRHDHASQHSQSPSPQVPIQPYMYPPYPYYPPMPEYMHRPPHPSSLSPLAASTPPPSSSSSTSPDYLMTGMTNPYEYRDASGHADPPPDDQRNRGGVTEPFPQKLHRMLEMTERDGLTDVVSFFSHGRAFAIHKPRRFVNEVMPRFFRQSKLTSFQRQLNLYGFRRISQGPDNGGYYHELFLKGRPGLSVNMKRVKVKGSLKIKKDPDTEPNFYTYPPIKPSHTFPPAPPPHSTGHKTPPTPPYTHGGYPYPPMYPHYAPPTGPYTAAQQIQPLGQPVSPQGGYPMYPYPPTYGYPWYPPTDGSPAGAPPQTSPIKLDERKSDDSGAEAAQVSKEQDGEDGRHED